MRTHSPALLTLISVLTVASSAISQSAPGSVEDEARAHFELGRKLVLEKAYANAAAEFAAGYELSGRPLFLFNMGECARFLGKTERARTLYNQYLEKDPRGAMVSLAKERLTELGPSEKINTVPALDRLAPRSIESHSPVSAALTPAPSQDTSSRPFYSKWPFWVGVGAVVVAGSVTTFFLLSQDNSCAAPECLDLR